jgi:AcrR family transcriptional regulator
VPRPRFEKLDQDKQDAILEAARAEFSEHGYADASQNSIIEAAGISKGALYYYFDDKNDLFVTVLERQFSGLAGVMHIEPADSADDFWQRVATMFGRAYEVVATSPESMALARSAIRCFARHEVPPGLQSILDDTARVVESLVVEGQRVRAVRTDLPNGLLVNILMKIGEGSDLWFAEHLEELSPAQVLDLNEKIMELFRRVATPSTTS